MDRVTTISFFVIGFALLLPLISRALSGRPKLFAVTKYVILGVYMLAYLYETVLFRAVKATRSIEPILLWSYRKAFTLAGGLTVSNPTMLVQILLNILLFIPLGYLLPFSWPGLREKLISKKVVLIGMLCSGLTEITQLVFKIGLFEFDDILNNTVGCLLGCMLYELIQRRINRRNTSSDH